MDPYVYLNPFRREAPAEPRIPTAMEDWDAEFVRRTGLVIPPHLLDPRRAYPDTNRAMPGEWFILGVAR